MARSSKKKAKDAAWSALSKAVRYSYAFDGDNAACVTCGHTRHWKEQQAGHWIPQAQGDAVRFDPRNVHCQCFRCNINLGGNGPEYAAYMQREYGQGVMDMLREKQRMTVKYTEQDYREMAAHYKAEFERMRKERANGEQGRIEFISYV
jgi:hypothetical protein